MIKWMGDKGLLFKGLGDPDTFTTKLSFCADNIILRHVDKSGHVVADVIIRPGDCIENSNGHLIRVNSDAKPSK